MHPLAGLVYCGSCGGKLTTLPRSRGRVAATAAGKTRTQTAEARVRIVAEPLEAYVEGYVIDQWRNPARSEDRAVR